MASVSSLLSEEQFLCCICLDVFTHPVTIPCGHNFCKKCITQAWDINRKYQCPICKELLYRAPELRVNTVLSEMADQFRNSVQKKNSSLGKQLAKAGDVSCDICSETKLKALKSCLVCLTSYCETHLEPHQRIPGLRRHTLIHPVENLEDRMCKKHDRPLELFCKTDQMCVCQLCLGTDHKKHNFVPLKKEYEQKKTRVEWKANKIQQMIRERQQKIEQIKQSVKLSKEDADRETADSVQIFSALIQCVERGLAQLIDTIEEKQKTTEKQAEGFIRELEEEVSELTKRSAEAEQLSRIEDHLQFLQSFPSLNPAPPTKDWTEVRVHSSHEGTVAVRRAVAQMEETLSKEMKKLCADVELKRVQQFAVDVTLDPETAHAALILSDDGKQVTCGAVKKNLPENPERFSTCPCVLGKQSFSSGRFYYEVQSRPQKVGVFVDYEEGLVSFYDVDAAALIYSFTGCNFTGKLYPFFGPCIYDDGKNSAPLIISPVSHTDYTLFAT
ncbi:hypothetical protein PAMA_012974 [Pampus argenteus]